MVLIRTENPRADQWKWLARFGYPLTIKRQLTERGHTNQEDELVDFIAGCFRQSEAYFSASGSAPLDIAPLLLYYGATSLIAGTAVLLTGEHFAAHRHGMLPRRGTGNRIADTVLDPQNTKDSALHYYARVFSDGCDLRGGSQWAWTLEEVLGSIPDLRRDFESCYQGAVPFTVPVQIIRKPRMSVERIVREELVKYPTPQDVFGRIVGLEAAYLPVQRANSADHVSLHPRKGAKDIGIYSTMGQKHLQLAHMKNSQLLSPDQIILMLMGLFALGHLSRYHPETWNPFVRRDDSGERLVVERFLEICQRYLPNLVLNRIEGARLQFVHDIEHPVDDTSALTAEDVEKIARGILRGGI
jgi:hypothetical protein